MEKLKTAAERTVNREFENIDQAIPESMPILNDWLGTLKEKKPFKGVTALLIQHQFGNQYPQTDALIRLGLDPARIYWLDIPYTSNSRFREKLLELKIPEKNLLYHDYSLLDAYSPYQMTRVQSIMRTLMSDAPDHLLVLDDGSYFLEAMATMKTSFRRVSIVEQTSRGIFKIEESPAVRYFSEMYPVVNVARSAPKMTLEPPFIGRAVCRGLLARLAPYRDRRLKPVLLMGFGAIGRSVAESLTEYLDIGNSDIYVFDTKPSRLKQAKAAGFSLWNRKDFSRKFGLVVGCTGKASFSCGDYIYLNDRAILASASSGTVELSRQDFIELADSSDLDDMEVIRDGLNEKDLHGDIKFRLVDREVVFLNGGFPVNFSTGHVNCIPTRYMEPTATMMVAAAVQAVTTGRKGLVSLDRKFCGYIDRAFRIALGPEAAVLD